MNCLITGIMGSGASYLAEYILENHKDWEVWGNCRWHSNGNSNNIKNIKDKIKIRESDLNDLSSVIRLLEECRPLKIFHMASTANVAACFKTPLSIYQNNVMSTANLFEAIHMVCPSSIVQLCSTSEIFGNPIEFPMKESHRSHPVNVYSASKLSQEALASAYSQSWGMKITITRAFAYWNPRRKDLFATSFASQVARIEQGKQDILHHGNLNSIRQLMNVKDMMRAYWIASEKCPYSEPFNIGGKDIISVGDYLKKLISYAKVPIICKENENLLRPKDVDKQLCDTSKFDNLTGFKPTYSMEESIQWLLDECRKDVANDN